jgi:two-component system, OmpR family, sensor kinase
MATRRLAGRARRWLAARTLRARLIAGLLALLALACATVGVVTYTHLHSVLIDELDAELTSASQRYSGCYSPHPPGDDDGAPPDPGQSAGRGQPPSECAQQQMTAAFTAVISQPGTVSDPYLAGRSGPCHLEGADAAAVASVPAGRFVTLDLSHYGAYRLTATQTDDGIVVTGLPLAPVTQTLRQVATAELAVFLAALVTTGVIGTAWVRFSLRPLRRVAATATSVTRLPLGSGEVSMPERVPDANPDTEVGQVGAAFNRMLGHVEAALARREASASRLRTFAADASHELRTPLAAIRGYAELARRRSGVLPADVAHALGRVESEASRMSELVDELLLLARLDAGRPLATDPVDLTRIIIDATSDARVAAADHQWQLHLPEQAVTVHGDEQRLRQVLANLLSNAARHTPSGTTVTVALATRPAPAGTPRPDGPAGAAGQDRISDRAAAVVSVTDTGPGIAAGLLPDVFERFVRGDTSRSRAAGSSGLGLAIVHAVTAAHGGSADVTSRPGRTTFTITLPVGPAG